MKTRELLNEWKSFLYSNKINEISIKNIKKEYPDFDESELSESIKGNTDFLDIIKNDLELGNKVDIKNYISIFNFYKVLMNLYRNNPEKLEISIPKSDMVVSIKNKIIPGSTTATYDDLKKFYEARLSLGKGNNKDISLFYQKVLKKPEKDFDIVINDEEWTICLAKTMKGSKALARSFWNGKNLEYDNTFEVYKGSGSKTGEIKWCTTLDGNDNVFHTYNDHLGYYMYYCIKKKTDFTQPDRKICISFMKLYNKTILGTNYSCVDANNNKINQIEISRYIGKDRLFKISLYTENLPDKKVFDIDTFWEGANFELYKQIRNTPNIDLNKLLEDMEIFFQYGVTDEIVKVCQDISKDQNQNFKKKARKLYKDTFDWIEENYPSI